MSAADGVGVSRRTALAGLIAALSAGCGKLSFMAANIPAAFGSYRRHADVAYGDHARQRLDVYVPNPSSGTESAPKGGHPLVVFWHGGRWSFGDKDDYRFVGAAFAALGCVAVLPNYRLYPEVKMPGFMEDAARAARWAALHAREHGAEVDSIYLTGHSAGAHLAALVTLDARYFAALGPPVPRIAGVIGLSGPYDFLPLKEADVQDMFGPPENYPESQPINFVHADSPPMLLIHGENDDTVRPKNSINLAASLRAAGAPVILKLYPKVAHADTVAAISLPARGRAPTLTDIASFLRQPRSS